MLRRGLNTACYHSLMYINHYLKNADQWQSYSPVWCHFICTICVVEIGMDGSIVVLTIAEHIAQTNPATSLVVIVVIISLLELPPAAFLLLLEIPHLPTLRLSPTKNWLKHYSQVSINWVQI